MPAPAKRSSAKKSAGTEALEAPPRRDPAEVFGPVLHERHARSREHLRRLAVAPPQVLLFEGGTVEERTAFGLWWAALLNCERRGEPGHDLAHGGRGPCLECAACSLIANNELLDLFFFDGREASIKIDEVRGLRATLAEAPRGEGLRVAIFAEAQALGIEAANALLKSLEEPQPSTCFVLSAPQRERLLPTLVSRSFVVTLAWPITRGRPPEDLAPWLEALAAFCATGKGWLDRTEKRNNVTPALANRILLETQKALSAALLADPASHHSGLATHLAALSPQNLRRCTETLSNAQDALNYTVNPALTLDWLATRFFLISRARR